MLRFGLPERPCGRDLGDDLAWPQPRGRHIGDGVLSRLALFVAEIEDRRAVASANVVALAIAGRGVVDLKEELQQIPVAQLLGIELDLDGFGMRAVAAVGGVGDVAAAVADARLPNAWQLADEVLHTPE